MLVIWLSAGPLTFKTEGYSGGLPSLVSTSYSWTKETSIIFLDQPVGTGFSYSTTPLVDKPSDTGEAKQTYEFLQKGYVLGNPITNLEFEYNHRIPYAYGMALISDELYVSLKRRCKGNYVQIDPSNTQCLKLMEYYKKCVSRINEVLILTPLCEFASPNPFSKEHTGRRDLREFVHPNLSLPSSDCYTYRYWLAMQWANDEDVRKALHVVKGSIGKWVRCGSDLAYEKDIKSSVPYHQNNSLKGYYIIGI